MWRSSPGEEDAACAKCPELSGSHCLCFHVSISQRSMTLDSLDQGRLALYGRGSFKCMDACPGHAFTQKFPLFLTRLVQTDACRTNSEVVVPYFSGGGELLGVLDVDSDELDAFREVDSHGLKGLCAVFKGWNAFREHVL